jgi:hypothetical protein
MDGSKKSDCIKKRPKLFIEKIMPVNLLNENASVQLMSFGNPLFEEMLKDHRPCAKLSLIEDCGADCLACFTSLRYFELC